MFYKRFLGEIFLLVAILLMAFVSYSLLNEEELDINRGTVKLQGHDGPPRFEEYPSLPVSASSSSAALDFSEAPEAEKYKEAFEDDKIHGHAVLASTYHAVALPCQASSMPAIYIGKDDKEENCYTLWVFDSVSGKVIKIGGNHYKPSELHLRSHLVKVEDEYYVVEKDSVRLIYVEWLDYLKTS